MHVPVMAAEAIEYLAVRPEGAYLDATCGLGGHTGAIARRLTTGFVIANDRDAESLELARQNTADCVERIRFHHGPFSELPTAVASAGVERVSGLLADFGVSRFQLTGAERGFSMMAEGPLDMRMDRTQSLTAAEIVNHTGEKALADLIFQFGEERRSRRIARAIVRVRPIRSTTHLASVVELAAPRTGKIHPATQTFMALRIAVNREFEELDAFLELAPGLVVKGGRIVVITFMSLEDRRVKRAFQELVRSGRALALTKHVVKPGGAEIASNPPSRSAKLRAVEIV
jgi:16S rRNA (cytosine1402-N4)-methyltransferase